MAYDTGIEEGPQERQAAALEASSIRRGQAARGARGTTRNFSDLTEQELLALAITLEEEDSRIYGEFAHRLRDNYPDTARMFGAMADEESGHRHRLLDLYRTKFGDHILLIRRQDVRGFVERK